MKKVLSLLTTLAMLVSVAVVPMSASADTTAWDGVTIDTEWAGEGTEASPYLITSAAELAGLAKTVYDAVSTTPSTDAMPIKYADYTQSGRNRSMYFAYTGKYFKLTTDIDLGVNNEWTPIGRFFMRFDGVFDGAGHVIKNVYMRNGYSAMGLFGGTGSNARIIDLGVDGVDISADVTSVTDYDEEESTKGINGVSGMGGLVGAMCPGGTADKPMLEGCFVKNAKIEIIKKTTNNNRGTGGLFGYVEFTASSDFYVKNCYVMNVDLDTTSYAGALFGANKGLFNKASKVKLINCYAGGKINLTSKLSGGEAGLYNFGFISGRSSCEYTNSYVSTEKYNKLEIGTAPYDEQYTDKSGIISAISTLDDWSVDNEKSPINDGYPILAWQNTWSWNGKTVDTTWAGTGTEADPYLITSAAELAGLANKAFYAVSTSTDVPVSVSETANVYNSYTGTHFRLTNDIDLGGNEWMPIGRHGMRFNGIFDGNNHVVKNFKMTTNYFGMGLFGATGSSVVIKNLGVESVNITFVAKGYNGGVFDYYDGTNGNSKLPNNDKTWTTDALYKADRTNGAGTLIGLFAGGTISNCYVKGTKIKNSGSYMAVGGLLGVASGTITSGERDTVTITNTYVSGADLGGDVWRVSAFIGTLNYANGAYVPYVSLTATNCYVTDFKLSNANQLASVFTSGGNSPNLKVKNTNCFADSASSIGYNESETGTKQPFATVADKATIEKALVTGNNVWNLDSVKNPINGGYPVLGWEKTWTVDTDPMSFYKGAGATVEGGKVTKVTVIQSDSAVSGTVIVAVYNGTRFENSSVETAKNGEITLTTPLAVDSGDTIKVFIWETLEGLRPLGVEYITTPAPSYSVEDGVMTVEYAGVLPDNLEFEDIPEETIASVKKIVIDDGVTGIGDNIFSEFTSIESVEIPRTVEEISDTAFPAADFTIYGCANGAAEAYADANNKEFLLKELRILSIGNSHTADHGRWNAEIWGDIADAGIETEIVYERITNSSHGMYYSASTDSAGYAISHYVQAHNPSSVNYSKYAKLVDEEWDLVLIQDYRESCVGIEGFTDAMAETTKWLRAAQPKAKIGWIVDWNDRTDSKDNAVLQQKFYDKTVTTVNNVLAMTSDAPDYIIPMGTAMQNARATYLGSVMNAAGCCVNEGYTMGKETQYNVLERDNTHLSLELGRYMMGAAVFGYIYDLYQDKLIGGDTVDFCDSLVTMPVEAGANEWKGEFTDSIWDIVEEVTENTIANPWTITNSVYTLDPAIAKAVEVENATYTDFTPAGIVATIKSLGNGFTVSESDVTIDGDTATVKFLYGYSEKIVTISK